MKQLFLVLMLSPFMVQAQNPYPTFENDTLYTTSGYTIYPGQVLYLGKGSAAAGYFNYLKFHSNMARTNTYSLQNSTILVNKLKNFKYTDPHKNSIRIQGTVTYKENGKKEDIDFFLNFEKATKGDPGIDPELIIPEKFRNTNPAPVAKETTKAAPVTEKEIKQVPKDLQHLLVADEIKKLFELYKAGALTKEEYESQKKKLLARQ